MTMTEWTMSEAPQPAGRKRPADGRSRVPVGLAEMIERWSEGDDIGTEPQAIPARRREIPTRKAMEMYLQERRDVGAIAARTRHGMRSALFQFSEHCPADASKITQRDVVRWLRTTTHLATSSRRNLFTTARGFTGWLLRRGTIRKDPFHDLVRPKVPRAAHRALEPEQVTALLAACIEPRETVIVVLGVHTGLRCAELAGLEVGDVNLSARTVFVRRAKGGGSRVVPLSVEACQVVARYVAEQGLSGGPLLRSLSFPQYGIRPETLGGIFRRLAFRSGVKVRAGDGVGCHSTRHTAATGWYESTGDVLAVRDLLGHESLATTQIYVRGMDVERLRSAVEGRTYLGPKAEQAPR